MTNKLFDSFVNDKLNNYESPVPEGLWEKIIAEEERKPKLIFWWNNRILMSISAFLILTSVSYLGCHNLSTTKKIAANNLALKNKKGITENELAKNTDSKNEVKNTDVIAAKERFENNVNSNERNIVSNVNKEKVGLNEAEKNNQFAATKSAKKSLLKTGLNIEKNSADFVAYTNKKNNFKLDIFNDIDSRKQNTFFKKNKLSTNKIATASSLDLSNDFYNFSQPKNNGTLVFSENNLAETNNLKEKKIFDLGKLLSGTDDCPTARGTYRNDTYIEGYFSPDFAFKNVTSTKVGNDNYLQKKDSSETMQMGFTIGARFSKSLTNNLLLKAGLQYSQMNEKFTLRTENDRRQTIVINSHTIVRAGQSDTTISDTSVFVQIGYRIRTSMNYYRNLEIPIMLSYEFPSEDSKWKFALNGGAILNITSWNEGKTFDASYNLVNIGSKANNGFYKHQFGVSLYGGFSVIRNITPEIDVFAEPYFRYGLSNVQSSVGFNQRFNIIGLQLGARLKISKNKHL